MLAFTWRNLLIALCLLLLGGCAYLPRVAREPSVFNPFPQLSKVAVVPFFNLSPEPSVDGRQFASAYAAELQSVPGFEVVPLGVVEGKMQQYGITFAGNDGPEQARKLAQLLEVDAVVLGAVNDFSPYYPPRASIAVEWYAANPGFHPIPPGYGLPWGTSAEEEIPDSLIFEAERALAVEQLKTQTPAYDAPEHLPPPDQTEPSADEASPLDSAEARRRDDGVRLLSAAEAVTGTTDVAGNAAGTLPLDWPDPRGFTPPVPQPHRPPLCESREPVLKHVRMFHGTDPKVTAALQTYVYFRDEARFGGWQSYLQRSDDFIRFCCHMHVAEMLTARGGAGQTQVVWRWPTGR